MPRLSEVTAVVLAGGLGTRLRPVISDRPKILADVNGRPFIAYLLDQLEAQGVTTAVISTGYLADLVAETLGTVHGRMQLLHSREDSPLGTGGGLRLALSSCAAETLLVLNGDSYVHADLEAFATWRAAASYRAALLLVEAADSSRYGTVSLAADDRIVRFEEKRAAGPGMINAGVYLLSREVVADIPVGRSVSLEQEVFPNLIPQGLYGYPCRAPFLDIGLPETYGRAAAFFRDLEGVPRGTCHGSRGETS